MSHVPGLCIYHYLGYIIKFQLRVRLQSWSLRDVEYPFIAITPRFTLSRVLISGRGPSIGQIELFNLLLGIIINIKYNYLCQIARLDIDMIVRVFAKDSKMVLDASLLNTQHVWLQIKGKVEQSRERSSALPTPWCSSYRKGSLRVALDYGRQLYFYLCTNKWALGRLKMLPTNYSFTNHIYIYMEGDLALNNLQGLICCKTQLTTDLFYYLWVFQTRSNWWFFIGFWVTASLLISPGLF